MVRVRLNDAVLIILLMLGVVALSGCSGNSPAGTATPSPAANVTPPPGQGIDTIGTIHSTQVRLETLDVSTVKAGDLQAENVSVTLENVGEAEVSNVGFSLVERDLQNGVQLYSDMTLLDRPIPAGGNVTVALTTGAHEDRAVSVIVNIRIYWGDQVEFWNMYNESRTMPPMAPGAIS